MQGIFIKMIQMINARFIFLTIIIVTIVIKPLFLIIKKLNKIIDAKK